MNTSSVKFALAGVCLVLGGCAVPPRTSGFPTAALGPQIQAHTGLRTSVGPLGGSLPDSAVEGPTPPGFISFCIRNMSQCDTSPGPLQITLTPDIWVKLQLVNNQINQSIEPEDDLIHYGVAEYWTIPDDGHGDCDDYVVTKRKALIDAGIPQSVLRIAIVNTMAGVRHAVLTVSTDRGDFVLDSLNPKIALWSQTEYVWLERQDPNRPWGWEALGTIGNDSPFDKRTAASAAIAAPLGATDSDHAPMSAEGDLRPAHEQQGTAKQVVHSSTNQ